MRKIIFYFMFLISLIFLSCATPYIAPKVRNFEKEREINKTFDEVWMKTIDWFGSQNTPIRTIDKASGMISTEYNLSTGKIYSDYCDCGKEASGFGATGWVFENFKGNFNIIVSKLSDTKTKIKVNCFFKADYNNYDITATPKRLTQGSIIDCESTGILEKKLLDYISQ